MLENVSQVAEKAATNVSRRRFLGRFGNGALAAAGALGAFLAMPRSAEAGRPCPPGERKCSGKGRFGKCFLCVPKEEPCPVVRCV